MIDLISTTWVILSVVCGFAFLRESLRVKFYRGYFFQKQHNAGRDPEDVLRKEFPNKLSRWIFT